MSSEEKAKELVDRFYQLFPLKQDVICTVGELSWDYDNWRQAKEAAIIHCDEIIADYKEFYLTHYSRTVDFDLASKYSAKIRELKKLKSEIEKL